MEQKLALKRKWRSQKNQLEKRLHEVTRKDPTDESLLELLNIHLDLNLEANKKEVYWKQRAHLNWLKHGDRNTIFFHKPDMGRK